MEGESALIKTQKIPLRPKEGAEEKKMPAKYIFSPSKCPFQGKWFSKATCAMLNLLLSTAFHITGSLHLERKEMLTSSVFFPLASSSEN